MNQAAADDILPACSDAAGAGRSCRSVESCAAGFGFPGVGVLRVTGAGPLLHEECSVMLVSELERQLEDREYCVQRLRIASLRRAGYGFRAALLLASEDELDFALAEKLSELGCPEDLALRILG
jgi:hypothetical protein